MCQLHGLHNGCKDHARFVMPFAKGHRQHCFDVTLALLAPSAGLERRTESRVQSN